MPKPFLPPETVADSAAYCLLRSHCQLHLPSSMYVMGKLNIDMHGSLPGEQLLS